MIDGVDTTGAVHQQFGQLTNQINESGNELFGADTSPELAGKVRSNRLFGATISKGKAMNEAVNNDINTKFSGKMALGGATAPVLINSGGTTVSKQPFNWGGLLGAGVSGGAQVASAAMAPGA